MKLQHLLLPSIALGLAGSLVLPTESLGFTTIGGSLSTAQRDFRIFNNFGDTTANNNTTPHASFPGYDGAEMAIWKACLEWCSRLHGDGTGDPAQSTSLGSGGANFDVSFQGNANGVGGSNNNIHSEISGNGGGVIAFMEGPISDGWRIRYYQSITFDDGPGTSVVGYDLQGIATHEYGHALGLGHTNAPGATMRGSAPSPFVSGRTINGDDIAGVQFIYGVASGTKPIISSIEVNAGQLTLHGSNFSSSGNDVWFTQLGQGGNGTPVKVNNVNSSGGGTQIVVTIPLSAGPGDVLVQKDGSGHSSLSNAWPVDPNSSTCPEPVDFCSPTNNTTGFPGGMVILGDNSVSANNMTLQAFSIPAGNSGLFIYSPDPANMPLGEGNLCVGSMTLGFIIRLEPQAADIFGTVNYPLDIDNPSLPQGQITAGSTWYFQFWYRDPAAGGSGFNFTNAFQIPFCP